MLSRAPIRSSACTVRPLVPPGRARLAAACGLGLTLAACAAASDGSDARHQEVVARDPAAMMRIAAAGERSGDLGSAAAFYRRAAALRPDLVAAEVGTARTLAQGGDVDQALDVLRGAHARLPGDADLTKTLGRLLVVAKRPADAVAVFDEGLAADPRATALLVGKGVALDKLGRHADAQQAYGAALAIDPGDATARDNLALSKTLGAGSTAR